MHIPEMELTGEESLLDVLMMCPEVISLDEMCIRDRDMVARGMLPVLFRRNLLRTEVDDAETVACHESPLADVVIQLGVRCV